MILSICAKVSDRGSYSIIDNGVGVADEQGYVPDFIEGDHYGDYLEFDIDIETGQIVNWGINKAKLRKWIRKNKVS